MLDTSPHKPYYPTESADFGESKGINIREKLIMDITVAMMSNVEVHGSEISDLKADLIVKSAFKVANRLLNKLYPDF